VCQLGFRSRYRLHNNRLPGRPDLVFPRFRKIIFVNGCFWHCHRACKQGHVPLSRLEYWRPKLRANKLRDKLNVRKLNFSGWKVLVIWECELQDELAISQTLANFLEE